MPVLSEAATALRQLRMPVSTGMSCSPPFSSTACVEGRSGFGSRNVGVVCKVSFKSVKAFYLSSIHMKIVGLARVRLR